MLTNHAPLQALPGVVLPSPTPVATSRPLLRKRIPDATSSPYFGLDRHLKQKAPSGRKRLLDDLNESGSPFVTSQELQPLRPIANTSAQRGLVSSRVISVDGSDIFGMSPQKDATQNAGDVYGFDSISAVDDHNSDDDGIIPRTSTRRVENQGITGSGCSIRLSRDISKSNTSGSGLTGSLSGGKRAKLSVMGGRASPASPETPRDTTAEKLRQNVRRMKL